MKRGKKQSESFCCFYLILVLILVLALVLVFVFVLVLVLVLVLVRAFVFLCLFFVPDFVFVSSSYAFGQLREARGRVRIFLSLFFLSLLYFLCNGLLVYFFSMLYFNLEQRRFYRAAARQRFTNTLWTLQVLSCHYVILFCFCRIFVLSSSYLCPCSCVCPFVCLWPCLRPSCCRCLCLRLRLWSLSYICHYSLTLQPVVDPVATPSGHLYSREYIYKCPPTRPFPAPPSPSPRVFSSLVLRCLALSCVVLSMYTSPLVFFLFLFLSFRSNGTTTDDTTIRKGIF
jgi:hypothetical protein